MELLYRRRGVLLRRSQVQARCTQTDLIEGGHGTAPRALTVLEPWVGMVRIRHSSVVRQLEVILFSAARARVTLRSEEHTSELQSLMRISYAVFCLQKKNKKNK